MLAYHRTQSVPISAYLPLSIALEEDYHVMCPNMGLYLSFKNERNLYIILRWYVKLWDR